MNSVVEPLPQIQKRRRWPILLVLATLSIAGLDIHLYMVVQSMKAQLRDQGIPVLSKYVSAHEGKRLDTAGISELTLKIPWASDDTICATFTDGNAVCAASPVVVWPAEKIVLQKTAAIPEWRVKAVGLDTQEFSINDVESFISSRIADKLPVLQERHESGRSWRQAGH